MASLGLTVEEVVGRLAQENVNLTGGRLQDGQAEYMVRTIMEIERAQDLNDIIVDSGGQGVVRGVGPPIDPAGDGLGVDLEPALPRELLDVAAVLDTERHSAVQPLRVRDPVPLEGQVDDHVP